MSFFVDLSGLWRRGNRQDAMPGYTRRTARELGCILFLLGAVTIVWCSHYGLWSRAAWLTPVNYLPNRTWDMAFSGDALWGMAATKAMADGEMMPILPKYVQSLGAPLGANWNDFPSIEEGINVWWALLAKVFGLFLGSNLVLLSAHLLAAISFYLVCRYLCYQRLFAFTGAALFALSRYAFWRNLPNLSLTFYWHLPLALLVFWWCIQERSLLGDRRKLALCMVVAVVHGTQSPYFSGIFMQFLFWAGLYSLLRWGEWRRLLPPLILLGVLIVTLLAMNADTIYTWAKYGANPGAAPRWYSDLERYALKPVELLVPRSHAIDAVQRWANDAYFTKSMILGEEGSAYCGIVGIAASLLLGYAAARAFAKRDLTAVPLHFVAVCLVLAFSVVGGINGVVGLSGMWLFRASNRYSILIFAILLMFLVRQLSAWSVNWSRLTMWLSCAALLAAGVYDQVPPRYPEREAVAQKAIASEAKFVRDIEARLPKGASIFQLPVYDFPEGAVVGTITDYEPFRPYLHSHNLRFSYGTMKGRHEERWQKEAQELGVEGGLKTVEKYGFSALLIDRRGYADRAFSLQETLRANGRSRVLGQTKDLICIALNPARNPLLPPVFGTGWSNLEGDYRHNLRASIGNASLTLYNHFDAPKAARLVFGVAAPRAQDLTISFGAERIYKASLAPDESARPVELRIVLQPGSNQLHFNTSLPESTASPIPVAPKVAFNIFDFRLVE